MLLYPLCFYGQGGVHSEGSKELTQPFFEAPAVGAARGGGRVVNDAGAHIQATYTSVRKHKAGAGRCELSPPPPGPKIYYTLLTP